MLLGAARYLVAHAHASTAPSTSSSSRAKRASRGGKAMIDDGLFERFPADEIYALHNWPGLPPGKIAVRPGPMMAAADRIEIHIEGRGGHGAHPHLAVDPVLVAGHIITAAQSIVARNVSPIDTAVVSLCAMHAGNLGAMSVMPRDARLVGTVRTFRAADAGPHRAPVERAGAFDRRRVRRHRDAQVRARLSGDDQQRARGGVRRASGRRAGRAPRTWCATSSRRWARRISRSCCRSAPARTRGWARAVPKAAASCTTRATTSTMT